MSVAGTYDCVIKTPMGDQQGVFTVVPEEGSGFKGSISSGMMGELETKDGTIDGNTLAWKMDMTVPMPMELDCEATVNGDQLTGQIKAGAFGAMELTGQRRG